MLSINRGIESNHLATSVSSMQRFFVQELCDVYIEFSKPVLYGNRIDASEFSSENELLARKLSAQVTLFQCLDCSMRLLHPFIPFVTEELWYVVGLCSKAIDCLGEHLTPSSYCVIQATHSRARSAQDVRVA